MCKLTDDELLDRYFEAELENIPKDLQENMDLVGYRAVLGASFGFAVYKLRCACSRLADAIKGGKQ